MNNPNSLSYMVSNIDLQHKINHKVRIIEYKFLYKYDDIIKLLPNPFSILIILIDTSLTTGGHWTALIRKNEILTYFDSYAKKVDAELQYINSNIRNQIHEDRPYLSMLLAKAIKQGYKLEYNTVEFQKYNSNINTCGKWIACIANAFIEGLNLNDFQDLIKKKKKQTGMSYDELINKIYNEM